MRGKTKCRFLRTIDNLSDASRGGREIPLPSSDSEWISSVNEKMECDSEVESLVNRSSITREEVMEIILDKASNLKRLRFVLSEDSSSSQSVSQNKDLVDASIKMEIKKPKIKKKTSQDSIHGSVSHVTKDDATGNTCWYEHSNKGPYIVFVRKLGNRSNTRSISTIEASRLLNKANINYTEIEFHLWNTWKISFVSY